MTEGNIIRIDGNVLSVEIQCQSACAGCALKNGCGMQEQIGKVITVPVDGVSQYKVGQKVKLSINSSGMAMSLFFAYILPLFCVLSVLGVGVAVEWSEATSAFCSLAILPPYYLGLHLQQSKLSEKIRITVIR